MHKLSRLLVPVCAFSILFSCGGVKVVPPEGMKLPPLQFQLRNFTYPSGLRVLVEKDDRTQLAGVFLVVGSGSTSDPAGKEGLAHYIEHLTFRSRPTGRATVWSLLDKAGVATVNAFTSFDDTVYYEVGLASHLNDMLQLEAKRMSNPIALVTDPVRATELDVVRNELRLKNETGYVGEVLGDLQAAVFPKDHPYARSVGGTHQSLDAITRADVDAYVRDHYRPENMTLLVLGNVDLATADKLIAENLPHRLLEAEVKVALPKRMPDLAPKIPESPPANATLVKKEVSITSPAIWVAWSMPRGFDADSYLLHYVAEMARGRLARVIESDSDIANIGVDVVPGVQASMLLCVIELHKGEHPEKSLARVLDEVPNIFNEHTSQNTVTEVAFGRERRAAVISSVIEAQRLDERGLSRATATHFAGDPTLYSRAVKQLTEMRQKQVSDYAQPYLTRERARALLFVPPEGAQREAKEPQARASLTSLSAPDAADRQLLAMPEGFEIDRLRELLALPNERASYQLPNGLTVHLVQRKGLPLLTASLLMPAVPKNLEEATAQEVVEVGAGIQFRYEAVLSGGNQSGSEALLNGSPEAVGAHIRKSGGPDHLSYSIEGSAGNSELLLAMLAEYVRTVSVERSTIIQVQEFFVPYFKRLEKDPARIAEKEFKASLLAGSPYGIPVGSAELANASQSAATSWIKRTHTPANATLTVVGDFELATIRQLVQDSFGQWSSATVDAAIATPPPALAVKAEPTQPKPEVVARPGATQSEIDFGCIFPAASDGAGAARHSVVAQLLQDRLWTIFRQKMGATYGLSARATNLRGGTSYLEVQSAVESTKLSPVLAAMKSGLATLGDKPATAEELAWAKVKIADGRATSQMSNDGLIGSDTRRATLGFPFDSSPADELSAVTAEQVRDDFHACLLSRPTLSIVGDEGQVRAALAEGWK